MKQILIILTFLIQLNTNAQNWPLVGTKWFYDSYESMSSYQLGLNYFEVTKDTVFENKKCVLLNSGDILYSDSNKTVYRYNTVFKKFYTLYKFNAKLGDSLIVSTNTSKDTAIYIINKIDTIQINNTTRKRFHIGKSINRVWTWGPIIEGIGSDFNMFPQYGAVDPCFCGSLRCFEDALIGLYKVKSIPCDTTIKTEIKRVSNKYRIYPNPFFDTFTIRTEFDENIKIDVFNLFGIFVRQYQICNSIKIGNELNSGIYILKIKDKKSIQYIRIVKI